MWEHFKAGPAALCRGNLQGSHPPDRTNLGPAFSWTPSKRGGRAGKLPAPTAWDAPGDDKIPDLERLKPRWDLYPLVKLQASLSLMVIKINHP